MKFLSSLFVLTFALQSPAESFKARLVDQTGQVWGQRGIRDLSLCGQDAGPVHVAEGAIFESRRLRIDCTTDTDVGPSGVWPGSEVRTLVSQGPTSNRIDLTIVSDGYTESEKARFFEDAVKIGEDLFGQDTFSTYRALFNLHAVFVPSVESGIGDGSPKNTALKLYRDSTYRQAVMPGDSYAADRASRLAPDTDYIILLGNDPFYGGLGGAFAITTSSPLNLTTVLRHELGHNFGRVGEEYDGGQVYDGANFSPSKNLSWGHWVETKIPSYHQAELLHYSAPWKSLTTQDFVQTFTVKSDSKVLFDFSSLGFDTKNDVAVYVDDVETPYDGDFNYDRNFYLIYVDLKAGPHKIRFARKANDANNIISKLAIYSMPKDFPSGTELIGGFATYNQSGRMVGYRPTDRVCLMKDMHSHRFCPVCLENMWSFFLKEVSLIDAIEISGNGDRTVTLKAVPLGNRLKVEWVDSAGKVRGDLSGQLTWIARSSERGQWRVRVTFASEEVRAPGHERWSVHEKAFTLN